MKTLILIIGSFLIVGGSLAQTTTPTKKDTLDRNTGTGYNKTNTGTNTGTGNTNTGTNTGTTKDKDKRNK